MEWRWASPYMIRAELLAVPTSVWSIIVSLRFYIIKVLFALGVSYIDTHPPWKMFLPEFCLSFWKFSLVG